MADPNTRSLFGSTYAPVDWNNADDPGDDELMPRDQFKGYISNKPYKKASALVYLLKNIEESKIVSKAYRKSLIADSDVSTNEMEIDNQVSLLGLVDNYLKTRKYQGLVGALQTYDRMTLSLFANRWLDIKHDVLKKALQDWEETYDEEVVTIRTRKASKESYMDLQKLRNEIYQHHRKISGEISELRKEMRNIADIDSSHINQSLTGSSISVDTQLENVDELSSELKSIQPEPTIKMVLGKMLESEKRHESATFLRAYAQNWENPSRIRKKRTPEIPEIVIVYGVHVDTLERERSIIHGMLEDLDIEPVGRLWLQKLDFTPMGHVKGELVYSLPLTPGEKISVSHREWVHTSEEYIEAVEMVFEEEQEQSISESVELTKSSQTEKNLQQKVESGMEAKVGTPVWSVAMRAGYSAAWSKNQATASSAKRNRDITNKASSRSKSDHKMSFKVSREVKVEDEQVRTIENTRDRPVRWDFYRLMQKWKIDLYNIGERLTYDIVIPEPASFLLRKYQRLVEIRQEIDRGDPFDLSPGDINWENREQLIQEYGIELDPPPENHKSLTLTDEYVHPGKLEGGTRVINFEFPDGYRVCDYSVYSPIVDRPSDIVDTGYYKLNPLIDENERFLEEAKLANENTFKWVWAYRYHEEEPATNLSVVIRIEAERLPEAYEKWQNEIWVKCKEAGRSKWLVRLEGLQNERERLFDELFSKEVLKLRQIEREEIMKHVLRWLFGPDLEFYPSYALSVETLSGQENEELYDSLLYHSSLNQHGEVVRFLQQAIEWENVNWMMYPYFWSDRNSWDFKQSLDHPDFYHRNFLRGGFARVVLTIRPEYTTKWLALVEGKEELTEGDEPYLTLAQEMKNAAETQYAYTPNPNRSEFEDVKPDDSWYEYTPTSALDIEEGEELLPF